MGWQYVGERTRRTFKKDRTYQVAQLAKLAQNASMY